MGLTSRSTPAEDVRADDRTSLLLRAAVLALVLHALLSIGSSVAFATFLAPPFPDWLQTPQNQRVMVLGFRYGGPVTVVFGALAGLLHAMGRLGRSRALALFAVAFSISLGSELLGTGTGYPFGPYSYSTQLGYLVGGRVPFNIPTSWFYMLYCSLAICGRLMPAADDVRTRLRWAALAAVVLTAWDVSMDPAMVATTHWVWQLRPLTGMSTFERIVHGGHYYGMPLTNWMGWLLTGFVVAFAMLSLVRPTDWAARVSPTRFPLALYAINGVLPVAICVGRGMTWAVVAGVIAMALPLVLAMRSRRADREREARVQGVETRAGDAVALSGR